jgi:hypothetical protein
MPTVSELESELFGKTWEFMLAFKRVSKLNLFTHRSQIRWGIFFYITNKSNNSLFTEKPRGKELPKSKKRKVQNRRHSNFF